MAWLEALGFCGNGESGPFVEGGARIALDGELPAEHLRRPAVRPGGSTASGSCTRRALQLRGEAGERQVKGAEVAVVGMGGGPIAGCLLLTRE